MCAISLLTLSLVDCSFPPFLLLLIPRVQSLAILTPQFMAVLNADCNGSAEMRQTASFAKLLTENKDCKWIYRFRANPGMPRGGIVPPSPVLAPGSALGSRPRVALSPSRLRQCNLDGYDRANSLSLDLARRLASAIASFPLRAAQMASARPASLSAGVM